MQIIFLKSMKGGDSVTDQLGLDHYVNAIRNNYEIKVRLNNEN
jgi:hypothetical protein